MDSLMPKPYGKELPPFFSMLYAIAHQHAFGRCPAQATMCLGSQHFCPDKATWEIWKLPLFDIFYGRSQAWPEGRGVDYSLIKSFHTGVILWFPRQHSKLFRWNKNSQRIGHWLWGYSPDDPSRYTPMLQSMLMPEAERRLHAILRGRIAQGRRPLAYGEAMALALALMFQGFSELSDIGVRVSHTGGETMVEVPLCPLCLDAPYECAIFIGICDGAVDMLNHFFHYRSPRHTRASIDPERSSGHRVIITYHTA